MNKKKVSKIIAYVLLAAVLIMTAGMLLTFTRGGTTSFKTFYAEHNGKKLFGDEQLSLTPGEEHRFDVKYTFDAFVEEEEKEYSVSIITFGREENQFTYTANGQPYGFDETTEVDVSEYFNLKKEEDHFTMELPADFSMASVLSHIHEGKVIEVAKSVDISAGWYFALKIQSYNEESTIILPFRQAPEEFEIDFNLKGVKADRKNPEVALGGYNETKLVFNFEDGFGPEGVYVLVEKCGSFNYAVEDGKLIVTITDPGPGVEVTVTAIQQTYKLIADELVGVEPVKDNPNTIALGKSVLLTFKLKEGYELEAYDALGGTIRLEKKDGDILTFRLSYEPEEYGDIHYCIYAAPGNGASFPLEVVYTTGALTPSTLNPQKVPVNGSVQLTFAVNPGYVVGRVVATGAEINYTHTDQALSISVANPTANVVIGVETRPAYDITTNTTGVIADVDNATKLVDGSNAILYFTAQSGYALPESVTVTGAGFQWTQSTGKLELRDPTGPITVEIVGVEIEQESYEISISYDKLHVTPYANNPSSIKVGEKVILRFTIHSNVGIGSVNGTGATVTYFASGQILTVTLNDTTGLVSVDINSRYQYNIATNLTNVSAVSGNPTSIADGTSVALYFTADPGYSLPASVTVTNAEYIWTQSTGKLELREPTGPITVVVEGVEIVPNNYAITTSYTAGHFIADESNAPSIEEGATVYLKFTISPNADFGTVTATGATVMHSVSGDVLTVVLTNPTEPVIVTITSRPAYIISTSLSHVSAVSSNPQRIVDGLSATLYFTADAGYSLPASVTVANAEYTWVQSTGKLEIREASGPVTVSVVGVEIVPESYAISVSYDTHHLTPYSNNPSSIQEGGTVTLRFTIHTNVEVGSVNGTGATITKSGSGQMLTVTLKNPTGSVSVTISSRYQYNITNNLTNVSAVSGNPTFIADGTSATLYFSAYSGYSLPASVTVINAEYTWSQSAGKLVLRDPTGPVTVSITGMEIVPESYLITTSYTAGHFTPHSTNVSSIVEGGTVQLKFTISSNADFGAVTATGATVSHSVSGQVLTVTLKNPTGAVTVTITSRTMYDITTNLSHVSAVSGNATTIVEGMSATLYFTADSGYELPASVTVTNAEYTWTQSAGKLVLRDPTGPVTVLVEGVVIVPEVYTITTSYNASHFSPYSTNVTTIEEGKTVALRFTISANADFGTVTATGATVSHSVSGQALTVTVKNPTGPVTVTITSRPKYSITTNLSHVSAVSGNATTIVDGMSATLYFTADSGYSLPASVTVIGAGYQWNQSSGKLVLLDPSGPVTVTVEGVSTDRPTYSITTKLTNVTANAGNDTTLTDSSKAILYFTAAEGYLLPESVTVTGADHQWDRSTGKLELREPTGNVTVTIVGVADPDYRQSYTITLNLLGASSNSGNPTIIYDDSSATLYFTARLGYSLPSSVTVTGAEYEWMQSLGKLVLRNPTGPVLVRVIGVTSGGSDPTPVVPMVMSALPAQAEEKYSA